MVEMYEFGWHESDYSESSSKKRNKQFTGKKRGFDGLESTYSYSSYESSSYEEYQSCEIKDTAKELDKSFLREFNTIEKELEILQNTMRISMLKHSYYSPSKSKSKLEQFENIFTESKLKETMKEESETTSKPVKVKKSFSKISKEEIFVPQTEEQLDKIRKNIAMCLGF